MSEIPQGWHSTTLATVAQLKTGPFGSALHKSDYVAGGTPLINPSHIKHGELQPDEAISIDAHALQRLSEYRLQAGDVVMGRRGEMGRCAVVPARAAGWVCGTGSVIVRPSSAILPNYLQRMLSSPGAVERLNGESVGSTMVNLNQGVLLGLPVALPPLMEQQRIAEKLDAVVARVDACRDRLARVTPLLKRFRQSVLAAATSGVLTDDWRVVRRRPAGSWSLTQLQAVAHVGTGSTPLRSNPAFFADTGTPWITSGATSQSVVAAASEFVTDAAIVAHRLKVYPPGTLLVAMYGEGKTRGQVSELGIAATINQACAAIQVDDSQATAAYVKLALMANYLEMRELAEGGNQPLCIGRNYA